MSVSTTLDLTAMNAALKELYAGQVVETMVYSKNPLLALIRKFTEFGGKSYPVPIIYGTSQGRSATFSNAQANITAASLTAFALTRKRDYSVAEIDNETMLASKTDKMAFVQGAKLFIDSAFRVIINSLAGSLYRSGTGTIGKISAAGITSGVFTLSDPSAVTQFEVNQTLQVSATDGGSARAAKGYVVAVDRGAGTVTVASSGLGGNGANPGSWQAGDFILMDGDLNAKISGLAAWIPASAPSATSFYGVDRSVDVTRLGGIRYDGSAQSIEEALIDAASLVGREDGTSSHAVMSFASYAALEKSLGAKVQYETISGPANISFEGIKLNGPRGKITCIPDRNCPGLTAYLLQLDTWELPSLGDAPQVLRYGDGLEMLRVSDADAGEVRIGYYANMCTNAPGWNAYVGLGA